MINQKVFSDTLYIILKDGVHFLEWSDTRQKLKHVLLFLFKVNLHDHVSQLFNHMLILFHKNT